MGAWGSGLYENDSTCDVRDTYMGLLGDGLSNVEAYKKTLEKLGEYIGDQDEPLLWFALAETQWTVGRLLPEVKEKALELINRGGGLELWEESICECKWKNTLENLKLKIQSPMPSEKKIRKPQEINNNFWDVNDVYAYRFQSGKNDFVGKYMLIQKIGEGEEPFSGETMMRIHVLDRLFDEIPTLDDIEGVRILPLDFPTRYNLNEESIWMSALILMFKKSEYPAKYLTYIGNRQGPENNIINKCVLTWGNIETWLYEFHQLWQGIEYETVMQMIR